MLQVLSVFLNTCFELVSFTPWGEIRQMPISKQVDLIILDPFHSGCITHLIIANDT